MSAVTEVAVPELPMPAAHYAHAAIAGGLLFISGILPHGAAQADVTAQAESIFQTMQKILATQNLEFEHVGKLTIFVKHISDRQAIDAVRKSFFKTHRPASTLVEITALADPAALVEIEAVAVI